MASDLEQLGRYSEPAMLVLSSLADGPKHGYAITKDVGEMAGVELGPGTLYGALSRLEERGLIEALPRDGRRRPYKLTGAGAKVLRRRLESLAAISRTGLGRLRAAGASA
jgi:DNA-binding PadR family transcriptional regulator